MKKAAKLLQKAANEASQRRENMLILRKAMACNTTKKDPPKPAKRGRARSEKSQEPTSACSARKAPKVAHGQPNEQAGPQERTRMPICDTSASPDVSAKRAKPTAQSTTPDLAVVPCLAVETEDCQSAQCSVANIDNVSNVKDGSITHARAVPGVNARLTSALKRHKTPQELETSLNEVVTMPGALSVLPRLVSWASCFCESPLPPPIRLSNHYEGGTGRCVADSGCSGA